MTIHIQLEAPPVLRIVHVCLVSAWYRRVFFALRVWSFECGVSHPILIVEIPCQKFSWRMRTGPQRTRYQVLVHTYCYCCIPTFTYGILSTTASPSTHTVSNEYPYIRNCCSFTGRENFRTKDTPTTDLSSGAGQSRVSCWAIMWLVQKLGKTPDVRGTQKHTR